MKHSLRRAGALAAFLAGAITSVAAAPQLADPAAAAATVPATRYETRDFVPRADVATPPPSQNWKALNQAVASYDSMALTSEIADTPPVQFALPGSAAVRSPAPSPADAINQAPAQPANVDSHAHHKSGTAK